MILEDVEYYQSLEAVRAQCRKVFESPTLFTVDMSQIDAVAKDIVKLIERDYDGNVANIPPHGRWRHFGGRVEKYVSQFKGNQDELDRALIDMFVVAVLLDAGAGKEWLYNNSVGRSEGIAIAVYEMFANGVFGPNQVNVATLLSMDEETFAQGFQHKKGNEILGFKGRYELMKRLGRTLENLGYSRPSEFINSFTGKTISVRDFWKVLTQTFLSVWPESRTKIDSKRGKVSLGDVWFLGDLLVPFHKLTQWLAYSLIEVMERVGGYEFTDKDLLTGLAEYRNGGLFIDYNVLKYDGINEPLPADSPVIIEWRALTIVLIDELRAHLARHYNIDLTIPQLLEAGTWKLGREVAQRLRNGNPPLQIISDGTVF